jgi:RND family efflux transporter MFP subunit
VRSRLVLAAPQAAALGIATAPLGDREPLALAGLAATVVVPPAQQRIVAAPVAGLLERVTVAVNDPVKAGQPIARLMSPALAELQRGVVQAAVQARLADDVSARDRRLFDEGLVAESRLRASESARLEAAAALAERRQALRLAGLPDATVARIEAGRAAEPGVDLVAPIDGVVLEQSVAVGSRVEAATALFRVARLAPLWLELQVPVDRLDRVAVGDAVEVPGTAARGRVTSIGRGAGAGQFVAVRAEVSAGTSALVPGQALEVRVRPAAKGAGGWRVPAAAVARHEGRVLVFVQAPDGFDAVTVRLLDEGDGGALVDGPLAAGDRVVVRGTAALKAKLAGIGGE